MCGSHYSIRGHYPYAHYGNIHLPDLHWDELPSSPHLRLAFLLSSGASTDSATSPCSPANLHRQVGWGKKVNKAISIAHSYGL